jgi:hypothetical protein
MSRRCASSRLESSAAQTSPPGPHLAAGLPQWIKSIQHDPLAERICEEIAKGVTIKKLCLRDVGTSSQIQGRSSFRGTIPPDVRSNNRAGLVSS